MTNTASKRHRWPKHDNHGGPIECEWDDRCQDCGLLKRTPGPRSACEPRPEGMTMKVLTATRRTQGDRAGDFYWAVDGELVRLPEVICDQDQRDPDGDGACGCGRAFAGMSSSRATTTVEVADRAMTRDDYVLALASSMAHDSWLQQEDQERDLVQELADGLLSIADEFPVGAVLGVRLGQVERR